jgi:hypothetical protein
MIEKSTYSTVGGLKIRVSIGRRLCQRRALLLFPHYFGLQILIVFLNMRLAPQPFHLKGGRRAAFCGKVSLRSGESYHLTPVGR